MNLPKISVVIPSFNQGQYIEDTLTSILDQNYPSVEIFVCDGGSKDGTVDVLKKYEKHLTSWVSEKDRGHTDAINKGLRQATGQLLAYLNSDDFFLPNAFHYIAQAYQAHPDAGLYTGNGLIVDGRKENPRPYMREIGYTYETLLRGSCYLLQPSTFISRRAWEKAGEFDDTLHFAMDLDYWLRVGRDFEVVLLNEPLSAWRMHEDIKTAHGGLVRWNELWRIYRRYTKDQLTPGLLVELFSILRNPSISQELGMDIRTLAGQCFNTAYNEMQKTLQVRDCIPVGRGNIFKPSAPAGPAPLFRAYPPSAPSATSAPAPAAPATPVSAPVQPARPAGSMPRVDIVLQATGRHAWAVGGGWETAARQLGVYHRTFRPQALWGAPDVEFDDGLFAALGNPQADILFLAGFDWHSQGLHSSPRWRERWQQCRARKILYAQESILHHEKFSGSKIMELAFRQAAALVDAIIYTDLSDRPLMESTGKPALFQPFGVDETIFARQTSFVSRLPRAFFRGKHQPFAGQASSYQDRRVLLQFLLDQSLLELVPYAEKPVTPRDLAADFNRFQVAVNFPSVFSNHPTRIYEAMACGCAVVTNRTGAPEIDHQFEHGRQLLYYSNREELAAAIRELTTRPDYAGQIATQGWREVREKHTLHQRLSQAIEWLGSLPAQTIPSQPATLPAPARPPAPATVSASAPPAMAAGTIVIDGVIFELQQGRPHGISRVWHRLLEQLARTPLAERIVLFDRAGTAPAIPGLRRRTIAGYNFKQLKSDPLWLQRWCDEEKAVLFISTYFTCAETTPSVVMLHDMIPEITGQNLAQPEWQGKLLALHQAVGYLAVSQSTVADFHRLYPALATRKIFLTPNATGDDFHSATDDEVRGFRQKYNLRKPYFLLVGRRDQYKNAALFFRAFAALPNCNQYEIVCAGGASVLEEELQPFVRGTPCHLLRLTDAELSAAYTGALALAYPSRYEGFGLPVLEAQKCGCPVITCRNSALAEVAAESVLYVTESDEAAMQQALLDVQRPETRQALIRAGEANLQRFSWTATGRKLAGAIQTFYELAAALPPQAGAPADTAHRLLFMLDQGGALARKLAIHLRTLVWQYDGLEYFNSQRTGAAEIAVATLLNQLPPSSLPPFAPLAELDSLTALVLGLAAEVRGDSHNAWDLYTHALTRPAGGILGFRLASRLARLAARGGDPAMAASVRQKIMPKVRATLAPNLDAAAEEQAVLNWPANITNPALEPLRQPAPSAKFAGPPLVTAIVSTFKSERFLRGCLEDLEAQTIASRLEIIVVDSHSPQNERAIVEEFQRHYANIVYIRTQERETVYGAWNRGARAARGKYLTNANTDDRHRADALEILARTLDENPGIALAYADCLITPHENEMFHTGNPIGCYQWLDFSAQDLWTKGCFAGPQPMWRREVHEEHGYFDAQMIAAGDYEFWLRLAQNRKFLHVREVLGLYLKSPASVEHANRNAGAKEVQLARERYRDAIMAGQPPFHPRFPEPAVQVEIMTGRASESANESANAPSPAPAAAPKAVPAAARVGRLDEARSLLATQNFEAAWHAALTALAQRPCHPEACLLLAEIALAAGDGKSAKRCAQHARELAPAWPPAKQFLSRPLKGKAKLPWLELPAAITRPGPATRRRLSICLIMKNEERFLAQCLKSVRGLATQLIVVDTGSTDRSVAIAREFGAEIYSFAWCDDFAAARNAALEHATGDWVLMLDADEELPAAEHARLAADMQAANTVAFRLPLVNAGSETEGRSFVPRLFRNLPGACFAGRIHEQIFASLLEHARVWGLKTGLGTAELRHHGYTSELLRDRNKVERNLKLLHAALAENPDDVNLVMNLGMELVRSDNLAAGLEKYRAAYAMMSAQPAAKLVPELREALLTQFTSQLYKVRAHAEVVAVLTSPLAGQGGLTSSLHFALGLAHFELKQFSEAAIQMRQCLAKRKQPGLTPINTDILTAAPSHCLAVCLATLGDAAAAETAFTAALAETSRVEMARLDYARFLRRQNRPVEALQQLHPLVAADPRNLAAWQLGAEIALTAADYLEFARDWTGEAFAALPENPVIAAQRAEALLLTADPAAAAPLWEKIWRSEPDPRSLAALILCEIAAGQPAHAPNSGPDELAASRALVEWYQKLLTLHVRPVVEKINGGLEPLARVLPTAAQMLRAALTEASAPAAV
jgi:glycosyltransferase involved in cell wall biosynthesis